MKMFPALNKGLLLAGTSSVLVMAMFATPQSADAQQFSSNSEETTADVGTTSNEALTVNVESPITEPDITDGLPFQISVDGKQVMGSKDSGPVARASAAASLDTMDIQLTFDGLKLDKSLNAVTDKGAYAAGENVRFHGFWNYGAFIENAEIRIFDANAPTTDTPLLVLELPKDRSLQWTYPEGMPEEVQFVLRVNGKKGNFDETAPKMLKTVADPAPIAGMLDETATSAEVLTGFDRNTLDKNGIAVNGGTVTVFGTGVPENNSVDVSGVPVPVDSNGKFVVSEILPGGDHIVPIMVLNEEGEGLEFQRSLYIPSSDLFYVGLGDFTIGTGKTSGPTELVGENHEWGDKITNSARVAAFARGKVVNNIFITAQADTGEAPLDEVFVNFLDRDPRKITDRIETFETYNSFGDQSNIERIVNTQGKFFVKVEQGESYAMWGNYQTNINGPVFASVNRSLYGAHAVYKSENLQTETGAPMIEGEVFVAQQGTVGHRDTMRGTGGSVYFLTYQDIQRGGEHISIEIRDSFTGLVKSKKDLKYGIDYDIDSMQGRVILSEALPSTVDSGWLVAEGLAEAGDQAFLVINYEYSPKQFDQFKDAYYGGRLVGRLGEYVTAGATFLRDENNAPGTSAKQLVGADVALSAGGGSYVRAEIAQTQGDPNTAFGSDDGGYSITDQNSGAKGVDGAMAYRIEANVSTDDFIDDINARLSAYYEHKDAGTSAGGYSAHDTDALGASISAPVSDIATLSARYDTLTSSPKEEEKSTTQRVNVDASANFDDITAKIGIGFSDTDGVNNTSVGGGVDYKISDSLSAGLNAQTSIASSPGVKSSSSVGMKVSSQIADRLGVSLNAGYNFENTNPDKGKYTAGLSSNYQIDDRSSASLGYATSGSANNVYGSNALSGGLSFGFKRRFTDSLDFYVEERLQHEGSEIQGLTHMAGVNFAPDEHWQGAVNAEIGEVGDINRQAISANGGYRGSGLTVGAALEYRRDDNSANADKDVRQTYVAKADASFNMSEDWTAKANANIVMSDKNGSFVDGNFVEGSVGAAYRPVDSGNFQGLLRYTFLYDLPTDTNAGENLGANGQIGSATNYKQQSHILEADGIFKINDKATLGAKYGLRMGQVTTSRQSDDWTGDTIHLGVLRADWHVVRDWDVVLEGRAMYQQDTNAVRFGAVAALYRHINDNFKVGVGYNFGSFNDDLTNVNFDSQGIFLNAIAKF